MSKICPNCQEVFDDNHGFCSNCGSRLVDNIDLNPMLNLGDANAISGGVNINQSKNITSHDTHYHTTTVQERAKSDSELKLDATNQLRSKAEEIMEERGRIDSVAMSQLRPMASHLGIDDETFKNIIKEVRSNRNGGANGLSAANARYLQQAQQAVQTNDMDALSNLTPRLEAMAAISQDDNVQYLYYLTLSILYPIKSMDVYERQTDENYWRSFWAIISYIRTGKHEEATKVLALFDPLRYEKSEDDQNLLEAYFNIMKEDKDGAQEFLDEILGEPTAQTKPLLRAVESTLYEEEAETLEVRFYMERVMSKSDVVVKSQKKMDAPVNIEEPTKKESKPESKQKEQPKIEVESKQTINKDNIDASELYERACTASGAKRVMLLQKAADAGSLEAMFDLGDCYYDGDGVDKNMPLAIKWMTKAADAGYTNAQLGIGMAYFSGVEDGLDQNYALSEKYLLLAANKDNTEAQAYLSVLYVNMEEYSKALVWARKASQTSNPTGYYMLGRIYNEGLGVEVDNLKALEFFEEAAKQGDADAQNIVGNNYLNADYIEKDPQKAFKYYQMAAAQGHLEGMANLGYCYQEGIGTDANYLSAEEWLRKAADGGLQDAIDILNNNPIYADLSQNEEDELTEEEAQALYDAVDSGADPNKLMELEQAAERGDVWGMFFYARLYHISKKVKHDFKLSLDYYTKAADAGNGWAMNNIGQMYDDGNGVKIDHDAAIKWFRKAANAEDVHGMFNLGDYYEVFEQDYNEAAKWFRKAADAGHASAVDRLRVIEEKINEQNKAVKNKAKKDGNKKESIKENATPTVKIIEVSGNSFYRNTLDIKCKIEINGYNGQILTLRHTAKPTLPGRKALNPKEEYWMPCKTAYSDFGVVVASDYNNAKKIAEIFKEEITGKYSGKYNDDIWEFCIDTIDCEDGVYHKGWGSFSYVVKELEISESCKRSYDANLSVFDENNNILASHNYELTIQYNHKMIGKDEVKVVS